MTVSVPALVWRDRGAVAVESRNLPDEPPPGHVRIAVAWCGVCGSDLHELRRGPVVIPATRDDIRRNGLVLGHELAGTVAAVAADVSTITPGQPITSDTLVGCGDCRWCTTEQPNLCPKLEVLGLTQDGGLTTLVDAPAQTCHPVPDGLPLDVAALSEPTAVALRAVSRAEIPVGATVVVAGLGLVGLLCAALARARGAGSVIGVEPNEARRTLGSSEVADRVAAGVDSLPELGPRPVITIDCTGDPDLLPALIPRLPAASRVVLVGVSDAPTPLDLLRVMAREITLTGSVSHSRADTRTAISLLARGTIPPALLDAEKVGLDGAAQALTDLAAGRATPVKVLIGAQGAAWTPR